MDHHFSKTLRIISTIVLSFFLWSFGGVFDIAYAVKVDQQRSSQAVSGGQKPSGGTQTPSSGQQQPKTDRPEEKFGKDMDDLENILKDDKADHETRRQKVRSKKTEIDADDVEIKKQFKATEEKISHLPREIRQRHTDFVRKYEDNLKELRTHLEDIDKAKTDNEKDLARKKAKDFVEKVKPPRKHQKLDPNKLPHRAEEPVWKEPRTRPEDFEREDEKPKVAKAGSKPILIASAGSLKGILSKDTQYDTKSSDAFPMGSFQTALSTPPTDADLAETIEVQFTPEIRAKAQELGYSPVKIYNWVRNNIEYVPTYGSIQGANMCLQTKLCNDFDTASLLIALLRASGIHAKYVYGTIELPIEKVKNWVGGFTDSMAALNLMASGGIPTGGITEGGQVVTTRKEHIWVEALVKYYPMRGARHINGQGDTWIPLDASFKQYTYTQGMDIKSAVPFDAQSFISQIQSTSTINEQAGYVTNVNSTYIQQSMQDYQTRVQNYITQNYPNATVGDVLGKKEIIKQEFTYLLGTLPYKRVVTGTKYSTLPDSLRHTVSFSMLVDNVSTEMQLTKGLPEIAGKKITLSYAPATASDEAVINSFLPKPHADGTPIQPSELPSSLPAYLINLKPELSIDGVIVTKGSAVSMGQDEFFNISISAPTTGAQNVSNKVTAGEYNAIALDVARITPEQITAIKMRLETTKAKLESQQFTGLTKDDMLGNLLYTTILSYFAELDTMDVVTANQIGVFVTRLPSAGRFFNSIAVTYMWGIPISTTAAGLSMDIGLIRKLVRVPDGTQDKQIQFMITSGMKSSSLEHALPEQLFTTQDNSAIGISAIKALQIANDQSIPIYTIDKGTLDTFFPQLQLDNLTKSDIRDAVNAGKIVTVSASNVSFGEWSGCGYIVLDPASGAAAYMLGGGLNGAWAYIGPFFSGLLTGLAAKYQNPDAMMGPLIKIENAKWLRFFAKFSAVMNVINSIIDILLNPKLNWKQMTAQIVITIGAGYAEYVLGAALASFFAFPVGPILCIALAIGVFYSSNLLSKLISEWSLLAWFFTLRPRFASSRRIYEYI